MFCDIDMLLDTRGALMEKKSRRLTLVAAQVRAVISLPPHWWLSCMCRVVCHSIPKNMQIINCTNLQVYCQVAAHL